MTRNRLLAVTLVALMLPISLWAQQPGPRAEASADRESVLHKIYDEDQKDRTDEAGDTRRREQVRRLLADGKVQTGEDYYYAAFYFSAWAEAAGLPLSPRSGGHGSEQGISRSNLAQCGLVGSLLTFNQAAADFRHSVRKLVRQQ